MNQIEIGKFIAAERKSKNYTQKQLSEILSISDKTVSKWECGKGFPEISLLLPLCNELDITVNELLSGSRLSDDTYKQKAEENIMNLINEKEENQKKWKLFTISLATSLASAITLYFIVVRFWEYMSDIERVCYSGIAIAILLVGITVAIQQERTIGYYKCSNCNNFFIPTTMAFIFGLHFASTRKLKCPHCGVKKYCKKTMSKDE